MIALRNIASLVKTIKIQPKVIAPFSSDRWKERDEASEKVYISKAEKQSIKKLLKKIEVEEQDMQSNMQEFERRLKDIMRRYKIDNDTLASEIVNLHKNATH